MQFCLTVTLYSVIIYLYMYSIYVYMSIHNISEAWQEYFRLIPSIIV